MNFSLNYSNVLIIIKTRLKLPWHTLGVFTRLSGKRFTESARNGPLLRKQKLTLNLPAYARYQLHTDVSLTLSPTAGHSVTIQTAIIIIAFVGL